nr:hypothetical protein [Tanacetum cinerariifolium]
VFSTSVVSRMHCVLCRLWFIFHHLRKKRRRRWNLRLKNPPSKHLVFEEPELDKQKLGKLEVGKPGVDKQEPELDKQELGKLEVGKPRVDKQEENQGVEFDLTSSKDDRSNGFTISLSSAASGEIPKVELFVLTLATTGLLRE